jgi:hypothetical protein
VGFRDEGVLKQVCKMIGNLKRWTRGLGGGGRARQSENQV